jgi:hypothetical protein
MKEGENNQDQNEENPKVKLRKHELVSNTNLHREDVD